jgi:hypothetical protein
VASLKSLAKVYGRCDTAGKDRARTDKGRAPSLTRTCARKAGIGPVGQSLLLAVADGVVTALYDVGRSSDFASTLQGFTGPSSTADLPWRAVSARWLFALTHSQCSHKRQGSHITPVL